MAQYTFRGSIIAVKVGVHDLSPRLAVAWPDTTFHPASHLCMIGLALAAAWPDTTSLHASHRLSPPACQIGNDA